MLEELIIDCWPENEPVCCEIASCWVNSRMREVCHDCGKPLAQDEGWESNGWWTSHKPAWFCELCYETLMAALGGEYDA